MCYSIEKLRGCWSYIGGIGSSYNRGGGCGDFDENCRLRPFLAPLGQKTKFSHQQKLPSWVKKRCFSTKKTFPPPRGLLRSKGLSWQKMFLLFREIASNRLWKICEECNSASGKELETWVAADAKEVLMWIRPETNNMQTTTITRTTHQRKPTRQLQRRQPQTGLSHRHQVWLLTKIIWLCSPFSIGKDSFITQDRNK